MEWHEWPARNDRDQQRHVKNRPSIHVVSPPRCAREAAPKITSKVPCLYFLQPSENLPFLTPYLRAMRD